jgi:homoserine kinase
VIYPHVQVLTRESRGILKKEVDFQDVIRQQGNLAAFVASMYTSDFEMMKRSLNDILVEPQRAHLIPLFYEMQRLALGEGALGFSISGAGPSMFALCDNSLIAEKIGEKAVSLYKAAKVEISVYTSRINQEGAVVC